MTELATKEKVETKKEGGKSTFDRRDFFKKAAAATGGLAFGSLALTNLEAVAQEGQDYVIVADVVRGSKNPLGAVCELNSVFKKGEQICWRGIIFSGKTGAKINDHEKIKELGLKMWVELEDGTKVDMHHSTHPPKGKPKVYFWAGAWVIHPGVPTGKLSYKVVVEDKDGGRGVLDMIGKPGVATFPKAITVEER